MPSRLKRYQQSQQLHFVTFTCYHRKKYLETAAARDIFEKTLERVRRWYNLQIFGYVVMPNHVHLLLDEPKKSTLAMALQMLKQISSRRLRTHTDGEPVWQKRYYDFNVSTSRKRVEKLRYMHRNPDNVPHPSPKPGERVGHPERSRKIPMLPVVTILIQGVLPRRRWWP